MTTHSNQDPFLITWILREIILPNIRKLNPDYIVGTKTQNELLIPVNNEKAISFHVADEFRLHTFCRRRHVDPPVTGSA